MMPQIAKRIMFITPFKIFCILLFKPITPFGSMTITKNSPKYKLEKAMIRR